MRPSQSIMSVRIPGVNQPVVLTGSIAEGLFDVQKVRRLRPLPLPVTNGRLTSLLRSDASAPAENPTLVAKPNTAAPDPRPESDQHHSCRFAMKCAR
jgi:hypothetical protein